MTILALVLAAATSLHAADAPAAKTGDIDGKKIYTAKCASCHLATGKGNPAMAKMFKADLADLDLTSAAVAKAPDTDVAKIISDGKNKMPAFKGKLKEAEISGLVAYIRTLSKPADKTK